MKNYILVGLGPFSKKYYFQSFVEKLFNIKLLIELDSQKENVLSYIDSFEVKPQNLYFINEKYKDDMELSADIVDYLNSFIKREKIDGIIIATEPKGHFGYIEWGIKNDMQILVDKPVFALNSLVSDPEVSSTYYKNFNYLIELNKKHPASTVTVCCQRRYHKGFLYLKEYLSRFIDEYQVPVSNILVNHCDGMWNMPNEFCERENHPYKYGYGKIMHSGYHFIDTMLWLLESNYNANKLAGSLNIYSSAFYPSDFLNQILLCHYEKFFGETGKLQPSDLEGFGEIDNTNVIEFRSEDGKLITTGVLNLLQNGFSRRSWYPLAGDTYKGNGRLRHENWNIQVGPLLNIQIHSYRSYESFNQQEKENFMTDYEAGTDNHFDIFIYRNSQLVGGKAFEHIKFGEENKNLMKNARLSLISDFVDNKHTFSLLQSHVVANKVISSIYNNLAKYNIGETPFSKDIPVTNGDPLRERVVGIIFNKNGKILIGQFNGKGANGKENYTFPAGGVEAGETDIQAMYKEIYEEFGIVEDKLILLNRFKDIITYFDNEFSTWLMSKKGYYYKGQINKTYLYFFEGKDQDIDLGITNELKSYKRIGIEEMGTYINNKKYFSALDIKEVSFQILNYLKNI